MNHPLGQACAFLTALLWGYALVLFKLSGERISPVALNLFKNAVGLTLLILTLAGMALFRMESFAPFQQHTWGQIGLLLLSGVIGIAVADTLFFRALNLIGVGLISIVDCCYTPAVILFAWLLLGEKLTHWHYVGAALIVAAVFTASRHGTPLHRTRGQIILGMLLAIFAVSLMALGIVMVKPILGTFPLIWASAMRLVAGLAALSAFAFVGRDWRRHWTVFRPCATWKHALSGSVLASYACLILWMAGFKYTYASVAGALNQTSVIAASILAAIILKERFGGRQIAALILGVIGAVIVSLGDRLAQ